MPPSLQKAWTELVLPLLRRPERMQVSALCHRRDTSGKTEILLITSRGTGRWILPKGWPIDGLSGAQAAHMEAWEEAGVAEGAIGQKPLGDFGYSKELGGGPPVPCRAYVYPIRVLRMDDDYPEAAERDSIWVTPAEAATMVDEPELRAILADPELMTKATAQEGMILRARTSDTI